MTRQTRLILASVALLLGLALMVGGIMTGKKGAVVVGLIVAAAAAREWISRRKQAG